MSSDKSNLWNEGERGDLSVSQVPLVSARGLSALLFQNHSHSSLKSRSGLSLVCEEIRLKILRWMKPKLPGFLRSSPWLLATSLQSLNIGASAWLLFYTKEMFLLGMVPYFLIYAFTVRFRECLLSEEQNFQRVRFLNHERFVRKSVRLYRRRILDILESRGVLCSTLSILHIESDWGQFSLVYGESDRAVFIVVNSPSLLNFRFLNTDQLVGFRMFLLERIEEVSGVDVPFEHVVLPGVLKELYENGLAVRFKY